MKNEVSRISAKSGRWVVAVCLVALPFCGVLFDWIYSQGYRVVAWKEEVELSDGRQVVINESRSCERLGRDRTNWICRSAEIEFRDPNPLGIHMDWVGPVIPVVFNCWGGEFYIVGSFPTLREYLQDGRPEHGYIGYKYINGDWHRIDFSSIPPEIYKGNLMMHSLPPDGHTFVSLQDKAHDRHDGNNPNSQIIPGFRDLN